MQTLDTIGRQLQAPELRDANVFEDSVCEKSDACNCQVKGTYYF